MAGIEIKGKFETPAQAGFYHSPCTRHHLRREARPAAGNA